MFKVQSLRNIELNAPYFHSGHCWDLKQAVAVMGESQLGLKLHRVPQIADWPPTRGRPSNSASLGGHHTPLRGRNRKFNQRTSIDGNFIRYRMVGDGSQTLVLAADPPVVIEQYDELYGFKLFDGMLFRDVHLGRVEDRRTTPCPEKSRGKRHDRSHHLILQIGGAAIKVLRLVKDGVQHRQRLAAAELPLVTY